MDSESSKDRTARWVQEHAWAAQSYSQHGHPQPQSKPKPHPDREPPPQSPTLRRGSSVRNPASKPLRREPSVAVSATSAPSRHPTNTKARSDSQRRHSPYPTSASVHAPSPNPTKRNGPPYPHPQRIPTAVYHAPNLPAFVQGPPGSGYPMPMTPRGRPLTSATHSVLRKPPSPPVHLPTPLNPKKSRPAEHKRRPSLTRGVFDPPDRDAQYATSKDNKDSLGQERRLRRRAASELHPR